jgi:hypothetical protein
MCVSAESQATLVKWTLNDVTFSDGRRAAGFFVIDTVHLVSPDWDIHGLVTTYTSRPEPTFPGERNFSPGVHSIDARASEQSELQMLFDVDLLHTTQGTYAVTSGFEVETGCSHLTPGCVNFRANITGGTVSAAVIPEPFTLAFLGLTGGLLVMMRKRL